MRTTTMSDMLHGRLLAKLTDERKGVSDCLRLFERNEANGWKGIPAQNQREQQERLPSLRRRQTELTEYIDALGGATTH